MTYSINAFKDNFGEYDDWIELYNAGPDPIDLGGLFISDSVGGPRPFRISSDNPDSTLVQARDSKLIWADNSSEQGILHVDFKLSMDLNSRNGVAVPGYICEIITKERISQG